MATVTSARPAPPRASRAGAWYWMPALVLSLGLVSLLMFVGINRIYDQLIDRDNARVRAIERIQLSLATAHLWLEEHLTGDEVDLEEIAEHLQRAGDLIGALHDGAGPDPRLLGVAALEDPQLRRIAERLRDRIGEFRRISDERQQGFIDGGDVGIGSTLDAQYDAVFRVALAECQALQATLEQRRLRHRDKARTLLRAILGAWSAIVGLAVVGLWSRERRRVKAEAALEHSRAQLLQSQKMDAVGRLAGGIAHDINNYLAAIRVQSEIVSMKPLPRDRLEEKMATIGRVVSKASTLIDQLLAFSRQQPIQPRVIDLNRIIEEGLASLMAGLVGEDVRFETRLEQPLWHVSIDPSQLEQVILNLAINAREAMPRGGTITIETANRPAGPDAAHGSDRVMLAVTDTGSGIPREVRDKIFDPFFTTKATGNGLGLATVYGIIEQCGGSIAFEEPDEGGSRFRILLPRSEAPLPEPAIVRRDAPAPAVDGTGKILLVEDNDELRDSTRAVVETLGYTVVEAPDGESALALFDEIGDDISLLITDVVMPGMGGKELVDRIRERHGPGPRVLFVSGYTDDVILRHGIERGDVNFLKKPFTAAALAGRILELLAP